MSSGSVAEHYRSKLGDYEGIIAAGRGIRVASWRTEDADTVLLGTLGMSRLPQTVPAGAKSVVRDPRTELVMQAARKHSGPLASVLCDLACYPQENSTFLHWFHAVSLGRPLLPGSPMTSVLLTFPTIGVEDFATLRADGPRIDFLEVVPITANERKLFDTSGAEALEKALEDGGADITDLFRSSVV